MVTGTVIALISLPLPLTWSHRTLAPYKSPNKYPREFKHKVLLVFEKFVWYRCLFFVCLFVFNLFIYLFLAVLGLHFCARAFSSCGKRGPLFIAVRGPLTIVASLVGSTGSRRAGSVVVAHGPSSSVACGIFPDQGSNPYPLHWQADSQPLCHQGSPRCIF